MKIVNTQQAPGCIVDAAYRRECGYEGIDIATCHARGCCYDGSVPDTFHCFQTPACAIDAVLRVECGYGGITMDECLELGCCYEANDNAPRDCYQKASKIESSGIYSYSTSFVAVTDNELIICFRMSTFHRVSKCSLAHPIILIKTYESFTETPDVLLLSKVGNLLLICY